MVAASIRPQPYRCHNHPPAGRPPKAYYGTADDFAAVLALLEQARPA
jgi:hypothetical protein